MGNCIPCSASETTQATISVNHRSTNTKPSSTTGTSIGTSNAVGISDLKVYTYSDLKKCTRGFKSDMVLSVGWFGTVYKGWVDEKTLLPSKKWTGFTVAVKKLNHESVQGFQEWQCVYVLLGFNKRVCGTRWFGNTFGPSGGASSSTSGSIWSKLGDVPGSYVKTEG
ncbi:putative transferase [Helianthus annuus]|uniref:Protein kinase domain-containing protein n=1 Tax=Helianthus annuus TaxID=4232 RepID=A0A251T6Y6_HELAN|nr:putative transferase [Helianthus annuus]KAJ0506853.1 putative transferase [Helianthus annuus]KAJ0868359.1 putative transferase [Helianthus annuus]